MAKSKDQKREEAKYRAQAHYRNVTLERVLRLSPISTEWKDTIENIEAWAEAIYIAKPAARNCGLTVKGFDDRHCSGDLWSTYTFICFLATQENAFEVLHTWVLEAWQNVHGFTFQIDDFKRVTQSLEYIKHTILNEGINKKYIVDGF